jgi:hypothetical protein
MASIAGVLECGCEPAALTYYCQELDLPEHSLTSIRFDLEQASAADMDQIR